MKKLKKIVTLLTLAAVCLTAPAFGKITAKAAEPNTYVLNFSTSKGEWRFKPASSGPRALLYDAGHQRR